MYVIASGTLDTIHQYTLSTAFDLSTASYASKTLDVSGQEAGPTGIFLKPDGTKMFLVGSSGDSVYQYSLSTAWDISSASYDSVSLSVSGQDTSPNGIVFKPDGTSMYIAGNTSNALFQYTLSTAWDLSTASYASKTFSVSSQDTIPYSIAFNADGTKMFVTGLSGDAVYQYSLSTAYDISTASYDSVLFDVSGTMSEGPVGMFFGDSGTKLFLAHSGSDTIFAYFSADTEIQDSTAYAMSLKVVQDSGASGYTVTWPTSVDWPSATAPTLTATASAVDQFVFYTYDGGTTWYGFTAGQALG